MMENYHERHVFVCFVKLKDNVKLLFLRAGIITAKGGDSVFSSIDEAMTYVKDKIQRAAKYNSHIGVDEH